MRLVSFPLCGSIKLDANFTAVEGPIFDRARGWVRLSLLDVIPMRVL